ncbi:phage tail protein [Streptomyces sp. NPDC056508]|uniref:phage tail tube protein n=1 Tax=Streptomyces sp. NPDC056508 TaxID=3345845 RepID=UPI0036BD906A
MTDTRNADLTFGASDYLVHMAALNTASPSGFAVPASPWLCLGWVTTDGGTFSIEDETTDVQAAGSLEPIRTLNSRSTKTMQCTFQEAVNPLIRALYDNVPVASLEPTSGTVTYDLPDKPADLRYAFVFDTIDGNKKNRLYMPNGKVTARGEEQPQTTDVWGVQLTFTFYKGASSSAVKRSIDYGGVDVSGFFPVGP